MRCCFERHDNFRLNWKCVSICHMEKREAVQEPPWGHVLNCSLTFRRLSSLYDRTKKRCSTYIWNKPLELEQCILYFLPLHLAFIRFDQYVGCRDSDHRPDYSCDTAIANYPDDESEDWICCCLHRLYSLFAYQFTVRIRCSNAPNQFKYWSEFGWWNQYAY